jgi:hypothetical protein
MIRILLLLLVALFVVIGGVAVALYLLWGWRGLIAFPFIMLALAWLAKVLIGKVFKRLALGLFGMKSGALRDATMTVHSIRSVEKPPERARPADDEAGEVEDASDTTDRNEEVEPKTLKESEGPKDYVEVDLTITPKADKDERIWEPGELMLATERIKSLEDLEGKEAGTAHSVEIWNGTDFGPDDPGKYPGEQRLKIVFAVKPGTRQAWLQYYNEPIGQLTLPVGTIDV